MAQAYAIGRSQGIFYSLEKVNSRPAASKEGASPLAHCSCSFSNVQPTTKNSSNSSLGILQRRNAVREKCLLGDVAFWRFAQKDSRRVSVVAEAGGDAETTTASRPTGGPATAKECVEEGLILFQKGRVRHALLHKGMSITTLH